MFKRLRLRLTVVCTLVTALVLAGMALASWRFSETQYVAQAQESFYSELNSIFFYLGGQRYIDGAWLTQTEANGELLLHIEDNGHFFSHTRNDEDRLRLTQMARQAASDEYDFDISKAPANSLQPDVLYFPITLEGVPYRAAACRVPVSGSYLGVIVLKSMEAEQAQVWALRIAFAGSVVVATLCLLLFAWLFTARAIRPVEESRRRQTEFISAASHELRSPLAVMQASAGAMQRAPLEQAKVFARNIEGECTRLSRLVDDMLVLARADNQRWSMEWLPQEPDTLLLSVSERFEPLAWEKGIRVEVKLPRQQLPRIRCDRQRIEQLLLILLDNALRYTPEGGRIKLAAKRGSRKLHLSVTDNGPGIPDSEKKLVFQRFYQGDAARTDKEHYGLGLSIAKEIAELHKGSLTVTDAPGGGAVFVLSLPL